MLLSKKNKEWVNFYAYRIAWSDEDQVYVVSIDELPGCMTHGETMEEAISLGKDAALGHIEALAKSGSKIPEPISKMKVSGEFLVRTTPDLHKRLYDEALAKGYKSLNKYVVAKLSNAV